ncbi:MAG: hypothetical protein CVV64_11895 [Candidatus Wallbacteria bacterium HGW-Wallbacteria-1]|uniref:Amidohydrolase-related domain-containing protein n=1 Tax=Candidatus Wallbacteria bacterium HGW-Wallbacteria-1 TaxID=2013854 RepID=A0A2N1PNU6_9BACT|nr:MAG: hypothetical protein CVV64_11895 [Candidatus Wallbacteria bacterium HGW-Wallbacteria-1]
MTQDDVISASSSILIRNGTVILPDQLIEGGWVHICDGFIKGIGPENDGFMPDASRIIEAAGLIVMPAFLDLHCHGAGGVDFSHCTLPEYRRSLALLADWGTVSVLPTLVSLRADQLMSAVRMTAGASGPCEDAVVISPDLYRSVIPGIHFEGPFINPEMAGSHNPENIIPPDIGLAREIIDECRLQFRLAGNPEPVIRFTLAPEMADGIALIEYLTSRGCMVSLGHSRATTLQANEAFMAGACSVTHLWNAMSRYGRPDSGQAGLAEAALLKPEIFCEIIGDGVHVAEDLIRQSLNCCSDRIFFCSDGSAGTFMNHGDEVNLGDLLARVRKVDGELPTLRLIQGKRPAASASCMLQMFRLLAGKWGLSLVDIARSMTVNPHVAVGLTGAGGEISLGGRASIMILDLHGDEKPVIVQGHLPYQP